MNVLPETPRFRPTVARVDLDALRGNYRLLRSRLPPGIAMMAAVKADAYGHGLLPVTRALEEEGVDWLGVAIAEEGLALRQAGVRTPMLVLGGLADGSEPLAVEAGLTPVVYRSASARALNALGARASRTIDIHLKVDTGMNRLGVPIGHLHEFLDLLDGLDHLHVDGVLTHLAEAEHADAPFTRAQLGSFRVAVHAVRERGHEPRFIHAANSAAIIGGAALEGATLVRPGISLYGHAPDPGLEHAWPLSPVMAFESAIAFLKKVPAGSDLSYGRTFRTTRDSKIATLPVGYGDGYFRAFGNRADAIVRGRRAPVVGRVCMDLCLLDVTDIESVREGDRAILLGGMGGERITAGELAALVDTIPYEIFTAISPRVPRVYHGRGADSG